MIRLSVCINTGRGDFPIVGFPNIHLFEHTLSSLRKQTYKNFEVIIADVLYETRPNYFKEHPEEFIVKHVPVKKNVWTPINQWAISTTKNTCLEFVTGDAACFLDDCVYIDENYLQGLVPLIEQGLCITTGYAFYKGDEFIKGDNRSPKDLATHNSMNMLIEKWEKINGYDEMFDGSKCLEDCDLAYRLQTVNEKIYFAYDLITKHQVHSNAGKVYDTPIKCPQMWWKRARERDKEGIFAANVKPLTNEEFEAMKECLYHEPFATCPVSNKKCNHINIDGICYSGQKNLELYKDPSLTFSLKERRKKNASIIW